MAGPSIAPAIPIRHGRDLRGLQVPPGVFVQPGRFGRLFPALEPRPDVSPLPPDLGLAGGPMDGGANAPQSTRIPAGFTFLGQFIDHDLTFDPTSSLEQQNDPTAVRNFRTPAFELDSLYGSGPADHPFLYDSTRPGFFLLSPDGGDLNRNSQGLAVIGDPRNDENLILSQLHLQFQRFHNAAMNLSNDFEVAQQDVRWHYQWIVLNEFLPLIAGESIVKDVLQNGRRHFHWTGEEPFMPVEFSIAAYRFGHSQVRSGYRINPNFAAGLFPADPASPPGADLRGRQPVPAARRVDWTNFFKLPSATPQMAMAIDTRISPPLLNLPNSVVGTPANPHDRSLAVRNLRRAQAFGLPSGQNVAAKMNLKPLSEADLWQGTTISAGSPAPLWFYILKEAEVKKNGNTLGDLGGRIVAEVFIGLLAGDRQSYLSRSPGWKPTFQSATPGDFKMADLIAMAATV